MTPEATRKTVPGTTPAELERLSRRLVDSYNKEDELYKSVLKLTELQHANLDGSGEVRDFITLLHQKEDLIRAIDKIEVQLDADKAKWVQIPDDQKGPCNAELNSMLDDIIFTIEKIMRLEQENEELLKTRKDSIEQELEAIRRGRKAAEAYDPKKDAKLISTIT